MVRLGYIFRGRAQKAKRLIVAVLLGADDDHLTGDCPTKGKGDAGFWVECRNARRSLRCYASNGNRFVSNACIEGMPMKM